MLEELLNLCKNTYITFELSTWYTLLEGNNRLVIYGIDKHCVELFHKDVNTLIGMAVEKIKSHKNDLESK